MRRTWRPPGPDREEAHRPEGPGWQISHPRNDHDSADERQRMGRLQMAQSAHEQDRGQVELHREDGRLFRRRWNLQAVDVTPRIDVPAQSQTTRLGSAGLRSAARIFQNLSIQIKASAASIVLLVCLLALGANAYVTSSRSASGLRTLSRDLVAKQHAFSDVSSAVVSTHMKIFRYVSWASNGVSEKLLDPLHGEIIGDLDTLSNRIAALAMRSDLSPEERATLETLRVKWEDCKGKAKDTVDVGQTDAAMAAMMIGQTDDSFKAVDADFEKMSAATTAEANALSSALYAASIRNQHIIVYGTLIALVVSILIAFVVGRSIVTPIKSITGVMQRLSAGETEVEIGHRDRRDEIGSMIEAISEGFSLYDGEDRLVICNTRYKDMFSYGDAAVVPGTTFAKIVESTVASGLIEDAKADGAAWLERRIALHRHPSEPHVQRRSDGRWIRVSERLTDNGGVVATYTDITELKLREAELANLVHELEVARDAADEASRTKSRFLANMSHELRTPLNAIIGVTELLQEDAREFERTDEVEPLDRVQRAARHLLALINDILDLAKIEAGRMELVLESFPIATVIEDVLRTVEPIANKNGNQLVMSFSPTIGSMYADQMRVRQALMNLVSNASKFTSKGTVTVSASRRQVSEGERIEFVVADTGIGMTAEQVSRLFQEFSQVDSSTTRKYGGTGLGLAISRRFCQMMGGDISVESQPGQGSRFTITLPDRVGDAEEAARTAEPARSQVVVASSREAPLILVVDDDQTVREVIGRYLEREGFAIAEATGGYEALRLARELRPAAISLDIAMPDLDGWSVLGAIKGDSRLSEIPVVLVTMLDERNRGFALGASEYLVKPIDRDKLVRVLRQLSTPPGSSILVVDDDQAARRSLRIALEQAGWEVGEAEDGQAALDRLHEVRPSVVLLDLIMPETDGFEVLEAMRHHDEWRNIPVIVITARDITAEDRTRLNGRVASVIQKAGPGDMLHQVRVEIEKCISRGTRGRT